MRRLWRQVTNSPWWTFEAYDAWTSFVIPVELRHCSLSSRAANESLLIPTAALICGPLIDLLSELIDTAELEMLRVAKSNAIIQLEPHSACTGAVFTIYFRLQ